MANGNFLSRDFGVSATLLVLEQDLQLVNLSVMVMAWVDYFYFEGEECG